MATIKALRSVSGRLLIRQSTRVSFFICNKCLGGLLRPTSYSQRQYSAFTTPTPPNSGFARLASRRLISLRGPDASHYLQGVITANISSVRRTSGFYGAFLNAQGRVLNDVFIYPNPGTSNEEWLIEVDAAEAEKLFKHIKRYKLRAKFDVRLVDAEELCVWSIWQRKEEKSQTNGNTSWTAHTIGDGDSWGSTEIGCVDSRAPGMGRRLILQGYRKPEIEGDLEETSAEAYTIRRYLRGVAEGQEEILREIALPQESNIDYMGGIDYRKGCYVGQELTIRTHHTGVVRKRILPLMLYDDGEELPQTLRYKADRLVDLPPTGCGIAKFNKTGRIAGKWLAGVGNVGLGLCRVEIMTDTVVQGESGSYREGDEFKLEWDEQDGSSKTQKVRAFVPSWHLTR